MYNGSIKMYKIKKVFFYNGNIFINTKVAYLKNHHRY